MVFRPLAGCGLFPSGRCLRHGLSGVSVPLRGVGCFKELVNRKTYTIRFPSPCGVWVVSLERAGYHVVVLVSVPLRGVGCFMGNSYAERVQREFPSPCGVWVVSVIGVPDSPYGSFRPLAGCGLFHEYCNRQSCPIWVSVPLRGVGCFECQSEYFRRLASFRPLAGCGLFLTF